MFACIFIPDFTVEAVLRAEPILRGQPVAVLEGKPPLCYVVGANEAARHLGVEIGMTKLLAETLRATEEPKNRGTEEQLKNRRSGEPKNETIVERSRRPHAQGGYETTYGQVNPRFGLYRTRLDAEELKENSEAGAWESEAGGNDGETGTIPRSSLKRKERLARDGVAWAHEASRQSSFASTESNVSKREISENVKLTSANSAQMWSTEPSLTLRQRSVAQEKSAHDALLDAAHAVSPRVENSAMDAVVLDVDGLERLFGTPQQIAQELVRRVTEVGLVANVAIAVNPDAAEHAARGCTGVTIISRGGETQRLGSLPLEVLFSAERSAAMRSIRRRDEQRKAVDRFTRMQETLDRWGIRNFRGLAALPPVSLSERLGADGVRLQTLASGTARRELVLSEAALRFQETIELEYPVNVLEPLAFLLARMLEGLCGRLTARALATNELRLRMRLEHRTEEETAKSEEELEGKPIVERKLALPVPMNDARLFLKLLQLELSANPPGAPVTQLWLEAEPAQPRIGQTGLFQPLAPEAQKLELTLARLHKLLAAREQIRAGTAEIVDTHQPDRFEVKRFQPESEQAVTGREVPGNPASAEKTEELSSLSLRRFRPPLAVEVELRDGAPVRLRSRELGAQASLHDNIVWATGPWRSCGNWWERAAEEAKVDQLKIEGQSDEIREIQSFGSENPEQGDVNWNSEEWDIALALTRRGMGRHERTTEIGLYRLVNHRGTGGWTMAGSYD